MYIYTFITQGPKAKSLPTTGHMKTFLDLHPKSTSPTSTTAKTST